jgi:hypothetical protein
VAIRYHHLLEVEGDEAGFGGRGGKITFVLCLLESQEKMSRLSFTGLRRADGVGVRLAHSPSHTGNVCRS